VDSDASVAHLPPSRRRSRADIPSRTSFCLRIAGAKSATIALAFAACLGGAQAQTTLGASPGSTYITDAGSDVTAELAVGDAIYDMKTKIKAGNRAGALADYNNDVGGVKTLFDATSDTGTVKAKFVSEYGSSSDIVSTFLTTVEAADVSVEAKNELVEKTLMDMVTMHLVLDKINTGTTVSDWDEAAAYYIGDRAASKTDIFTTYDRADEARGGG
jgi:hypothetical protein